MTLIHLFLIHRYQGRRRPLRDADRGQPSAGREHEAARHLQLVYEDEIGEIIVADVDSDMIKSLVEPGSDARERLIAKA